MEIACSSGEDEIVKFLVEKQVEVTPKVGGRPSLPPFSPRDGERNEGIHEQATELTSGPLRTVGIFELCQADHP